ncbi:hypothetical protein J6590_000154 [Homalodisca vitripennis]|nr:hypothetical protein J6590_000154 [Homalodisca vitripennis]
MQQFGAAVPMYSECWRGGPGGGWGKSITSSGSCGDVTVFGWPQLGYRKFWRQSHCPTGEKSTVHLGNVNIAFPKSDSFVFQADRMGEC